MTHNISFSFFCNVVIGAMIALTANMVNAQSGREITLIDDGWNFSLIPDSASSVKPFQTIVDLPHDWSIVLPFDRNAPAGNDGAYLPTGKGIYTRNIDLGDEPLDGNRYFLLFDGVYERWTLKVNGDSVGFRPYGYSSVMYEITPFINSGINRIEVDVDNSHQRNSRWYSGSGIFRHVNLVKTSDLCIAPWSLFVTTPSVSDKEAEVDVAFDVDGYEAGKATRCRIDILDNKGKVITTKKLSLTGSSVNASLTVSDPQLWSPVSPALYTVEVSLIRDGRLADTVKSSFGIRTIEFSAEDGFRLNGKNVLLNGACVHHDNGILGAASYDAAEARKVRLLKEAGFNAVRTSHNLPSPVFLDECDRQGLLVIDEAFDGWRDAKTPNDYSVFFDQWSLTDVGDMIRRDRNHPSIIAWSIGNEVIERKKIEVVTTARRLAAECRRLDPTRPVTEALCAWDSDWEIYDPHAEALDIVGYNYMIHKSESDHARDPQRIMWQTESYPADAAGSWRKVDGNPYIIGDFVWTGLDYLGESGIGRYYYEGQTEGEHYHRPMWPWHGAYCGDVDLTGLRKPISHYRDMLYNGNEMLYMAVREPDGYNGKIKNTQWSVWPTWESWTWKGHEGKEIEVEVMSRYPIVKLYINGDSVGEALIDRSNAYRTIFKVPYSPGTLEVVGCDGEGTVKESRKLSTAGAPRYLRLTPDKLSLRNDNQDISFVVVELMDNDGNVVPDADAEIAFSVSGPASIIASGNADMASTASYTSPETATWKGRAVVAVKSTHEPGNIVLTAKSPGIKTAIVKINSSDF